MGRGSFFVIAGFQPTNLIRTWTLSRVMPNFLELPFYKTLPVSTSEIIQQLLKNGGGKELFQ